MNVVLKSDKVLWLQPPFPILTQNLSPSDVLIRSVNYANLSRRCLNLAQL